jgi:hypothetical protein
VAQCLRCNSQFFRPSTINYRPSTCFHRQRPPVHREPGPRIRRSRSQWPGDHLALGLGGCVHAPGTHIHEPPFAFPFQAQLPSTQIIPGPGGLGGGGWSQRGGGIVGATIIVLGAQGEPRFPKFSDTDGWATALTIPAAIMQTARAVNSLFLLSTKV